MSEQSNVLEFPPISNSRQIFTVTMRESTYTTLTFPSTDKKNALRFATQLMRATSDEGIAMREEMQSVIKVTAAVPVCVDLVDGSTQ